MEMTLLADYIAETDERLERISAELLRIEHQHAPDLTLVKRELHTLKGLSASLDMGDVARLCHTLEDHLARTEADGRSIDFQCVFSACDFLAAHLNSLRHGEQPPGFPAALLGALVDIGGEIVGAREPGQARAPRVASRGADGESRQTIQRRYLVVDDDELVRRALMHTLSKCGECLPAAGGKEAVSLMEQSLVAGRPFDAVCLDIDMPGMDGHQTLEMIRCLEHCHGYYGMQGAMVVMVTGQTGRRHEVKAFKNGCQLYLKKPCSAAELKRALVMLGVHHEERPRERRAMSFLADVTEVGVRDAAGMYQPALVHRESSLGIHLLLEDVSHLRPGDRVGIDYRGAPMTSFVQLIAPLTEAGLHPVQCVWDSASLIAPQAFSDSKPGPRRGIDTPH